MTKVYFVRHAEVYANVFGYCYGVSESDITSDGEKQLEALAERFKDIDIDVIYASPLKRTMETAKAINLHHGAPIHMEGGIIEADAGTWERKSWEELEQLYPNEFAKFSKAPHLWSVPEGESMENVYKRMHETVTRLVKDNRGKTIVFVSHACALQNFFCFAKSCPFTKLKEVDYMSNTGISYIEFDKDLNIKIIFENDISHLENRK